MQQTIIEIEQGETIFIMQQTIFEIEQGEKICAINRKELMVILMEINGKKATTVNLMANVNVPLLRAKTNVFGSVGDSVTKVKNYLVMLNYNYATSNNNNLVKQGSEADFVAKSTYATKVDDNYNACITTHEKTGQMYLTGKQLEATKKYKSIYYVNGIPANEKQLTDIVNLLPEFKAQINNVEHRNFKIENIKEIKLNGILYVITD